MAKTQAEAERKRRWAHNNRERTRAASRRYNEKNPGRHRAWHLLTKYGLTEDAFNNMVDAQNGCCAICGEHTPLVVDHCHVTGRVRGLLCGPCNTGIGHLGDDPERVRAALIYLEAK